MRCEYVFFFSSRRRHTRLQGDWSSDVCSSDLLCLVRGGEGCGKTSLLQMLAGQLPLQGGRLAYPQQPDPSQRPALFWRDPRAELSNAERARPAQDWVQAQRQLYPAWGDAAVARHRGGPG